MGSEDVYKRQDYEQAAELFQKNYEMTKDLLSAVGWIECLLEPSCDGFDENKALKLCNELSGNLRVDILKVRILMEGSKELYDPREAMKIIQKDIDLACDNRDFPLQPFPEFAAAYVWFSFLAFDPPIIHEMRDLLEDAVDVLKKRMKMEPDSPKDVDLMEVLEDLLDEYEFAV